MKLILLGAPGAGKGTQAEVISQHLGIPTISTGNIIREALKSGSEMGRKAKSFMDSGKLVPDDVVIGIIQERLAQPTAPRGSFWTGSPAPFPRPRHLTAWASTSTASSTLKSRTRHRRRVSGRRVCPGCGATYHVDYKKPAVEGVCDRCSDTLVQRKDDQPDTVQERLNVYHEQTEPLKNYYAACGKLVIVEGQEEVAGTTRLTSRLLRPEHDSDKKRPGFESHAGSVCHLGQSVETGR